MSRLPHGSSPIAVTAAVLVGLLAIAAPASAQDPSDSTETSTGSAKDDGPSRPYLPSIPKARPQVSSADLDPDAAGLGSENEVLQLIETRAKYLRKGDRTNADDVLKNILDLARSLHIRNMPLVSGALMYEARLALKEDGPIPPSAILAASAAAQLSPDLAEAHFLKARLLLSYSLADIPDAYSAVVAGLERTFGAVRNRVAFLVTIVGVLISTLLMMIFVYACVQLSRHIRFVGHDLVRALPDWVTEFQGALFIILGLLAIFLLGFGIAPALAVAIAILIPYQDIKERVVSGAFLALLAAMPVAVSSVAPLVAFFGGTTDALLTASSEAFANDAEARLVALAQKGRVDHDVAVVLGLRARNRGDLVAAETWYRAAIKANGNSVIAKNNLAKLLYARREQDEAKDLYTAASNARTHAEPWLNRASLELDLSRFDGAQTLITAAQAINPQVTAYYSSLNTGLSTSERLLEIPFDESSIWPRVVAGEPERNAQVTAQLWKYLGGKTPPDLMAIVAVALGLVGAALGQKRKEFALSAPCTKCGRAANPFVAKQLCDQCRTIFLKAVAVDPSTRERKEKRIRFYQRRLRWTERILAIVPGAGDLFGGRTLTGITFLFFFTLGAGVVFWVDAMSFHPWSSGPTSLPMPLLVFIGIAELGLVIGCLVRAFR